MFQHVGFRIEVDEKAPDGGPHVWFPQGMSCEQRDVASAPKQHALSARRQSASEAGSRELSSSR